MNKLGSKEIGFVIVLIGCFFVGRWLSLQKPLWNDEIYTQERAIDQLSYKDILIVKFVEGNNSPLFYVIQKVVSDLSGFSLPMEWKGEWYLSDRRSQVIMRLAPNFFMSLTLALLFYFFARYYSYALGFYALFVGLSSTMVWTYWAEARPYAMWIFLTTAQALIFLRIMQKQGFPKKLMISLSCVHILLSLSVILSLGQIFVVSLLLIVFKEKQAAMNWHNYPALLKKYFLVMVLPLGICFFYYWVVPSSLFRYCVFYPAQLIFANMPEDRIILFLVYACMLCYVYWKSQYKDKSFLKQSLPLNAHGNFFQIGFAYLLLIFFLVVFAVAILLYCMAREIPEQQTVSLSDRYFMFLAPIEIIATTVFSYHLFRFFKKKKMMWINLAIFLIGLLLFRYLKTAIIVFDFYN